LLEEPHRLRQAEPDEGGVQRGHSADRQCPSPAVGRGRHDEVTDQRGQQPAHRPERLERDDDATTDPGGGELADQGGRDGKLRSQAKADQEPEEQQRCHGPRQRGGPGGEPVDQQGGGEHLSPADTVRKQPAQAGPDRHPDETDGRDPGQRGDPELPLHCQRCHHEADQAHVHGIERPAEAGPDHEPAVLPGERKAVKPDASSGLEFNL